MFLLDLNNTNTPTPELVKSPEINELNDMAFPINNSVKITEEAQFGINPINEVIKGANMLLFKNILFRKDSP